jgi:transcriptional regulator with XRE-family HTH domain
VFDFGRVEKLIKKKHINAKILADSIGVSSGNITDWKTGKSKPSSDAIVRMADYFDVSADWLLGRVPDPNLAIMEPEMLPDELKGLDIEAVYVLKEALNTGLTAEDIKDVLRLVRKIKK